MKRDSVDLASTHLIDQLRRQVHKLENEKHSASQQYLELLDDYAAALKNVKTLEVQVDLVHALPFSVRLGIDNAPPIYEKSVIQPDLKTRLEPQSFPAWVSPAQVEVKASAYPFAGYGPSDLSVLCAGGLLVATHHSYLGAVSSIFTSLLQATHDEKAIISLGNAESQQVQLYALKLCYPLLEEVEGLDCSQCIELYRLLDRLQMKPALPVADQLLLQQSNEAKNGPHLYRLACEKHLEALAIRTLPYAYDEALKSTDMSPYEQIGLEGTVKLLHMEILKRDEKQASTARKIQLLKSSVEEAMATDDWHPFERFGLKICKDCDGYGFPRRALHDQCQECRRGIITKDTWKEI